MKKLLAEIKNNIAECDILLRTLEKESKCINFNISTANILYDSLNKKECD